MSALAFDTHEFIKKLRGAGFSEEQAETITDLQKATVTATLEQARHDYKLDNLGTKQDLKELEVKLSHDIELIRAELKRDILENRRLIDQSSKDLAKWLIGVIIGAGVVQIGFITALMLKLADKP